MNLNYNNVHTFAEITMSSNEDLGTHLFECGLDSSYWSEVFHKHLGVQSSVALQYMGDESYQLLVQFVKHQWEKKVLQKLLKVGYPFQSHRQQRKVNLAKRQTELLQLLKSLKDLQNDHRDRQDTDAQKLEKEFCERLQVPENVWLSKHIKLTDAIKKMQNIHKNIGSTLKDWDDTEISVVTKASNGLALCGVLITGNPNDDISAPRQALLRAPKGIKLEGPLHPQYEEVMSFECEVMEQTYLKYVEMFGYSMSTSTEEAADIGLEIVTQKKQYKKNYSSTIRDCFLPLASCTFKDDQLKLSKDALFSLQRIDKAINEMEPLQEECEKFFYEFGSHVFIGPFHFGGRLTLKCYSHGFKTSEKHLVQQLQHEVLNAYLGMQLSKKTSISSLREALKGNYPESLTSQTFLQVSIVGGPNVVIGFPDWKNGLIGSNRTWHLIDRGPYKVAVWEIIEMNHKNDFENVSQLVIAMKLALQRFGQTKNNLKLEVQSLADYAALWNKNLDQTLYERRLRQLVCKKEKMAQTFLNPKVWPRDFLSQPPLQCFLKSVIESCMKDSTESCSHLKGLIKQIVEPTDLDITEVFHNQPTTCIKQLVEPTDLDNTEAFRDQVSTCKWLYGQLNPLLNYQDFLNIHKYFKIAMEIMDTKMVTMDQHKMSIQPHHYIKATTTVANAVTHTRNYLGKTGQQYEDCFMVTMLYPFRYDPDKGRCLAFLTRSDLEYLITEFPILLEDFFSILQKKSPLMVQAYILFLMVKLYDELFLSEGCIKYQLHYLQTKLDMESEVTECISELESKGHYWEWFKDELKSLAFGSVVVPRKVNVSLQDVLLQSTPNVDTSAMKHGPHDLSSFKETNQIKILFTKLGLLEYFPQKLSLRDAISIREDTFEFSSVPELKTQGRKLTHSTFKDTSQIPEMPVQAGTTDSVTEPRCINDLTQITPSELTPSAVKQDSEEFEPDYYDCDSETPLYVFESAETYPFVTLQSILAFDHRCRRKLTISYCEGSNSDDESDSDDDNEVIHPMDGLLALIHCSDNFLRQDIFSRLSTCQLAVPLLLPNPINPITHEPLFLLWALRTIVKEFKIPAAGKSSPFSGPIVSYPAPIVSFLRIGHHTKSKSHLMNCIINTAEHNTFFHYNCDGGSADRVLVNGVVEISWYLPSKNDSVFPDATAFVNLHGDANVYVKQTQFLSEICCMHFVLLNEDDKEVNGINEKTKQLLKLLSRAPGGVVILQTKCSEGFQKKLMELIPDKKKLSIINMLEGNEADIRKKVQKKIMNTHNMEHGSYQTLEAVAHKCGLPLDENDPYCVQGYELANQFYSIIKEFKVSYPSVPPKELLVLQGTDLWHEYAKMDKEQHRQHKKGHMTAMKYGEQQRKRMDIKRKKQFRKIQNLTELMHFFLTSIVNNQGPALWYYMKWITFYLDDLSRKELPELHARYHDKRKELNDIRLQEKKDERAEKECQVEMTKMNMDLINASFGVEHLLREVSQMYEAVVSQKEAPLELRDSIICLPRIAAQLLFDGFSIELLDGDASHMPKQWIFAVLENLSEILKKKMVDITDPRVFVMSVLGLQSTGKSTMLNTVFGVQFSVSAGRCTRGAFMQLLPVHKSLYEKCGVHFFLLIDTEGLRAPELDTLQTQKHDNELATFVIGVANLTIINVKGELSGDMDDILQTAVHAFLRMKRVDLRPSCYFVHQNVTAITADEKAMVGRFKIKDKLDEMTLEAAKEAGLEREYEYFSKVITFDYEKDVTFSPDLWTGSPPMAPVSVAYSLEAQRIKQMIVCGKLQDTLKSGSNSFSHFKEHLGNLWNAILVEDFVFSFRNTYEIVAYKTLEEQYGEWSWGFKKQMIEWEHIAQNKLIGCSIEDVATVFEELKRELSECITELHEDYSAKMDTFFKESTEKDIIEKWKCDTEIRLKRLSEKLRDHAFDHCAQLLKSRRNRASAEAKKESLSENILVRVKALAEKLDNEESKMSEDQLIKKFEESWDEWMIDITAEFEKIQPPDIHVEVENRLKEYFQSHRITPPSLTKTMSQLRNCLQCQKKLEITEEHLKATSVASKVPFLGKIIDSVDKYFASAQTHTDIVLEKVNEYLSQKQHSGENFNPDFTTEMLEELHGHIHALSTSEYQFTEKYRIDMAVTACKYAIPVFEEMASSFMKRHDPVEFIKNELKPYCLRLFNDKYNQIAQEKTAADALCHQLQQPIKECVIQCLSAVIVDDMRGILPWIKSKPTIVAKILLDIGKELQESNSKKDHFHDCAVFLKDSKASLKHWLVVYAKTHCDTGFPSQLTTRALQELSTTIKFIKNKATEVTGSFSEGSTFSHWMTTFHAHVGEKLSLSVSELRPLLGDEELQDVTNFTEEIFKGLDCIHKKFEEEFSEMKYLQMTDVWKPPPHEVLFDEVAGCTAQCPFCRAQCELTNDNHSESVKHSVQHRPQCLGGYCFVSSQVMCLDICTLAVTTDDTFRNNDTNQKPHPFKKYTDYYPQWSIPADASLEASLYWKWLVGNYTEECVILFGYKEAEIPNEWKDIEWEEVEEWIKQEYRI